MTKKEITKSVQAILYRYGEQQSVSAIADKEYLLELFERHPDWITKKGSGVAEIVVRPTLYKNRCFWLIRTDRSETDISFTQCINGKSSKLSDIKAACRSAIRPEIIAFREHNVVFGQTTCAFTDELLTESNLHIDHYDLTFDELFTRWVEGKSVEELFTKMNNAKRDSEMQLYFTDEAIINEFRAFHNQHTNLRAVSKQANLSILKRRNSL